MNFIATLQISEQSYACSTVLSLSTFRLDIAQIIWGLFQNYEMSACMSTVSHSDMVPTADRCLTNETITSRPKLQFFMRNVKILF